MSRPTLLTDSFDMGFMSDVARDALPKGAVWRMKDYVPREGARARRRGAASYASRDLQAAAPIGSGNLGLRTGVWAPFRSDPHLIVGSGWGDAYRVAEFDGDDGNFVSGLTSTPARMVWHPRLELAIIPSSISGTTKKYYDPTGNFGAGGGNYSITDLAGSPLSGAGVAASWGDFLVLARGATTLANRVMWSQAGSVDSWPALGTYDAPEPVQAVVCRGNQQMLFGQSGVHMLIGDTPPPGGNLAARPFFFSQGTIDGRTVQTYGDTVIWANQVGVWRTDGTSIPVDIAEQAGISKYWRAIARTVIPGLGSGLTAGVYRGYYFLTAIVRDFNYPYPTTYRTLVCDLDRNVWFEWQGIAAASYITRPSSVGVGGFGSGLVTGEEELFMVSTDRMRVAKLSSCFSPGSDVQLDPWGDTPNASIETAFYRLGTEAEKRFRRAYVTRDLRAYNDLPSFFGSTATANSGGAGTALVVNVPTDSGSIPAPNGSIMLLHVMTADDSATDITPPAGWTKVRVDKWASGLSGIFWKVVNNDPVSYTFDFVGAAANHHRVGHMLVYKTPSNLAPTPLPVVELVAATAHATQAIDPIPYQARVISFWAFEVGATPPTYTSDADMTARGTGTTSTVGATSKAYESLATEKAQHHLTTSAALAGIGYLIVLDRPGLKVAAVYTPDEDAAYEDGHILGPTEKPKRNAVPLGKRGNGVALKIEQAGDLQADVNLFAIEIDGHALEGSND